MMGAFSRRKSAGNILDVATPAEPSFKIITPAEKAKRQAELDATAEKKKSTGFLKNLSRRPFSGQRERAQSSDAIGSNRTSNASAFSHVPADDQSSYRYSNASSTNPSSNDQDLTVEKQRARENTAPADAYRPIGYERSSVHGQLAYNDASVRRPHSSSPAIQYAPNHAPAPPPLAPSMNTPQPQNGDLSRRPQTASTQSTATPPPMELPEMDFGNSSGIELTNFLDQARAKLSPSKLDFDEEFGTSFPAEKTRAQAIEDNATKRADRNRAAKSAPITEHTPTNKFLLPIDDGSKSRRMSWTSGDDRGENQASEPMYEQAPAPRIPGPAATIERLSMASERPPVFTSFTSPAAAVPTVRSYAQKPPKNSSSVAMPSMVKGKMSEAEHKAAREQFIAARKEREAKEQPAKKKKNKFKYAQVESEDEPEVQKVQAQGQDDRQTLLTVPPRPGSHANGHVFSSVDSFPQSQETDDDEDVPLALLMEAKMAVAPEGGSYASKTASIIAGGQPSSLRPQSGGHPGMRSSHLPSFAANLPAEVPVPRYQTHSIYGGYPQEQYGFRRSSDAMSVMSGASGLRRPSPGAGQTLIERQQELVNTRTNVLASANSQQRWANMAAQQRQYSAGGAMSTGGRTDDMTLVKLESRLQYAQTMYGQQMAMYPYAPIPPEIPQLMNMIAEIKSQRIAAASQTNLSATRSFTSQSNLGSPQLSADMYALRRGGASSMGGAASVANWSPGSQPANHGYGYPSRTSTMALSIAPSINGVMSPSLNPQYTPSLAPSERSTIGQPKRFNAVSMQQPPSISDPYTRRKTSAANSTGTAYNYGGVNGGGGDAASTTSQSIKAKIHTGRREGRKTNTIDDEDFEEQYRKGLINLEINEAQDSPDLRRWKEGKAWEKRGQHRRGRRAGKV
ncbi:hypothetical protein K402DRAFT_141124 [Aulographum hederae CBS 113979]|uniref:Uncharacterized protein n=1 Tax=Aulographum hederae CBS 113979 TaxID=1176131 RepID=A0A6G1GV65_9PEZI|nr:hypothetical protein K402DRAFT_141124 [Aulographum hederae CBS 113979]